MAEQPRTGRAGSLAAESRSDFATVAARTRRSELWALRENLLEVFQGPGRGPVVTMARFPISEIEWIERYWPGAVLTRGTLGARPVAVAWLADVAGRYEPVGHVEVEADRTRRCRVDLFAGVTPGLRYDRPELRTARRS